MGWGSGYVQVLGTGVAGASQTGVTRYTYTANGQLAGTTDTVDARKNQRFINDAQGRVLRKRANHIEGSASTPYTERHTVAAGQTWAISTSQVGEAARAAAKQAGRQSRAARPSELDRICSMIFLHITAPVCRFDPRAQTLTVELVHARAPARGYRAAPAQKSSEASKLAA